MNLTEVCEYESSDEEDMEVDHATTSKVGIKRPAKIWLRDRSFDSAIEAIKYMKAEKDWSLHYKNNTSDGEKHYYRCNKAKRTGPQCAAAISLLFCSESHEVIVYTTDLEHTHDSQAGKITAAIKAEIKNMYNLKLRPKAILREINRNNNDGVLIKMSQLRNALQQIKKTECGGAITLSVGQLEKWCIDNSSVPFGDCEPFIVAHEFIYNDEISSDNEEEEEDEDQEYKFRFFISSKCLLRLASNSTHICADGTYKLNWHGFPLIVLGTTDLDRHFHSFGVSVCTNERKLDYKFAFDCINIGNHFYSSAFSSFLNCKF